MLTPFAPGCERGLNPLDSEIGLNIPTDVEPIISAKDGAAPSLAEAQEQGLLPTYAACVEFYASLA